MSFLLKDDNNCKMMNKFFINMFFINSFHAVIRPRFEEKVVKANGTFLLVLSNQ